MKISYTGVSTYQECAQKYKLHYKEKLRSTKLGSALFFGKAMDAALCRILLNKKKTLTDDEQVLLSFTPEALFEATLKMVEAPLGGTYDIRMSEFADYFMSDLDMELLQPEDIKELEIIWDQLGVSWYEPETVEFTHNITAFIGWATDEIRAKRPLETSFQKAYNSVCWYSLYRKGLILLKEAEIQLDEMIETVYSIQEKVSLEDEGDEFIGYIDAELSFKDEPGIPYVTDFKTSSKPYKEDAIRESKQLPIYCEYKQNFNASYIVIEKKLRKKDPKVRIQVLREKLDPNAVQKVFEEITETMVSIEGEKFEKNWDACFSFGKPCQFYNYCRTGDTSNLVGKNE